jgi:hypothetical protein
MRHFLVVLIALAVPSVAIAATDAPDTKPPTIKITGLPNSAGCTKTTKVGFVIFDSSGLRRVYVFLDGNVVAHSEGNAKLNVHFPKRVKAGRHRLGVLARDKADNLARKVVHFKVCRIG